MILKFGKYKGWPIKDVFYEDKLYVEWLYNNHDSELIRSECGDLLYSETSINKIEEIVLHCLQKAGYSETESKIFVKKLKSK